MPFTVDNSLVISNLAEGILAAVSANLNATASGCPTVAFVANGDVVLDRCCPDDEEADGEVGGMLFVTVTELFPTYDFPGRLETLAPASTQMWWAVTFTVGCVRCQPTQSDAGNGGPPSPEQLTVASQTMYADMAAIGCALKTYLWESPIDGEGVIANISPYGPDGGCGGVFATVTINASTVGL